MTSVPAALSAVRDDRPGRQRLPCRRPDALGERRLRDRALRRRHHGRLPGGRSAANASWNFAGSIASSTAVAAPYCAARAPRRGSLSFEVAGRPRRASRPPPARTPRRTRARRRSAPRRRVRDHRAAVRVADRDHRPGDLRRARWRCRRSRRDAAQRVGRRDHRHARCLQALDHAVPARPSAKAPWTRTTVWESIAMTSAPP